MTPARLLTFEARNPSWRGDKETRIRKELGLSPARYVVLLERAAASIEGRQADPLGARRLLALKPPRIRWGSR
ncbi:DUF3263 domain-containing protein [Microbacterium sp. NPDC056052]|uniref:DUF3263 domain-containing protein n=1 Tax=Microbacterium sp. NPDC056052 TaxID=3345695 RepID=UPI0035D8D13D